MKSFETTIKPLLKYGDGVAKETGKKFKEFGCTKVLAGYDANLPESVVSTVLDSITAEGIELIPYSCPYADGQDTGVLEVRQLAIDHQVDGFLAMGGGSTMDIVKAATCWSTSRCRSTSTLSAGTTARICRARRT